MATQADSKLIAIDGPVYKSNVGKS